jgi:hypothetical protein
MSRAIGVFNGGTSSSFASQTNGHNTFFALERSMAKQNANSNFLEKKHTRTPDSSQRTAIRALPKQVNRTNYTPNTPDDVKRAIQRVRNSGCTAPRKKGAR